MRSSLYALDVEFIKCRGLYHARSVAFVPFRAAHAPPSRCGGGGGRPAALARGRVKDRRRCILGTPTLLSMHPSAVMQTSEVLPSGHVLLPLVTAHSVAGEALASIKARHCKDAEEDIHTYQLLRRLCCKDTNASSRGLHGQAADTHSEGAAAVGKQAGVVHGTGRLDEPKRHDEAADTGKYGAGGGSRSRTRQLPSGPSSTEVNLRRRLHTRLALAQHFHMLDPYSIPNVRCCDGHALRELYRAPASSSDFVAASRLLNHLCAYGAGSGGKKALCFLARHHPPLLQDVLRASFRDVEEWYDWLRRCADAVECDLWAQREHYQNQPAHTTTTTATATPLLANESCVHSMGVCQGSADAEADAAHVGGSNDTHAQSVQRWLTSLSTSESVTEHMNDRACEKDGDAASALPYTQWIECGSLEELSSALEQCWRCLSTGSLSIQNVRGRRAEECPPHASTTIIACAPPSPGRATDTCTRRSNTDDDDDDDDENGATNRDSRDCRAGGNNSLSTNPVRFFVYGSMDRKVLRATLALRSRRPDTHANSSADCHDDHSHATCANYSSQHVGSGRRHDTGSWTHRGGLGPMDITRHTLFRAAGFTSTTRQLPSLSHALSITAAQDHTAHELCASSRPHDPVWDAAALACVCVQTGVASVKSAAGTSAPAGEEAPLNTEETITG